MGQQFETGEKHFHLWIFPDAGYGNKPKACFARAPKFRSREQAMRAAVHYGADREDAMARACHC